MLHGSVCHAVHSDALLRRELLLRFVAVSGLAHLAHEVQRQPFIEKANLCQW